MTSSAVALAIVLISILSIGTAASFVYFAYDNPTATANEPTLTPSPIPIHSTKSPENSSTPINPIPAASPTLSPNTQNTDTAVAPFSYDELIAKVQIQMPSHEGSYNEGLVFGLNVEFYNNAPSKELRYVPYQNISVTYSIDNGEWKTALFNALTGSNKVASLANGGYWYEEFCNYSAVVEGLCEGVHFINVSVSPSQTRCFDFYSPENAPVLYFTVHGQDVFSCRITSPSIPSLSFSRSEVPLAYMLNAEASWVGYSLDGGANVTINGETTMSVLTNGRHNVIVYANDTSGAMTRSSTVYFSVSI